MTENDGEIFFSVFEWFLNYLTASVGPESYYLSLYNLHTVALPPPKGVLWVCARCSSPLKYILQAGLLHATVTFSQLFVY